ncbi:MAG: Na(+)-translocating NADH-quinone reductase subunit A [Pseudohongiellaceae bacterium]
MIRIKRGLDVPITGEPKQHIGEARSVRTVAVLGRDYIGMKPTMLVAEGDRVKLGQALFTDKKNPSVSYTAPGCGVVSSINRGYQRAFLSIIIDLDGDDEETFDAYSSEQAVQLDSEAVKANLLASGLWTALRTRPFSKVPAPESSPYALFINAMDSNPLAANPDIVMDGKQEDFVLGVKVLSKLPENGTHLILAAKDALGLREKDYGDGVKVTQFQGPHPAGLPGTHIHTLEPAGPNKPIWTINYQDVIAIGRLFTSGRLNTERVLSLGGPQVVEPRLVKTRVGASLDELLAGELVGNETRIVSGSVLGGRKAEGVEAFLGRYHLQVTALREGRERPLLGYLSLGANRHSAMGIYISQFFKGRKFPLSTSTQGSDRAMVPIGAYEKIMPLDVLPTQLLRALIVGDIESATNLGALELDEEDLALCSYVCPGKYEYGPILRDNLTRIEKEGL